MCQFARLSYAVHGLSFCCPAAAAPQSVLAGEKLAPALLDFAARSSKQQPKAEEGAEVAAAPAAAALDEQ
jgi:hypothetical protein